MFFAYRWKAQSIGGIKIWLIRKFVWIWDQFLSLTMFFHVVLLMCLYDISNLCINSFFWKSCRLRGIYDCVRKLKGQWIIITDKGWQGWIFHMYFSSSFRRLQLKVKRLTISIWTQPTFPFIVMLFKLQTFSLESSKPLKLVEGK